MSRRPAILGAQVAQSHGRRQSHAVDEEGVDRRVGESSAPGLISVDRRRIEVAHRGEVIGAPRKEAGVGQLRASGM
jgi:hypothetical protein